MGRVVVIIGWVAFFIGIGLYLMPLSGAVRFLVPAFTLTGICLAVVGLFLSYGQKKSR